MRLSRGLPKGMIWGASKIRRPLVGVPRIRVLMDLGTQGRKLSFNLVMLGV